MKGEEEMTREQKIRYKEANFAIYKALPIEYRLAAFDLMKKAKIPNPGHGYIDAVVEMMSGYLGSTMLISKYREFAAGKPFGTGNDYFDQTLLLIIRKLYKYDYNNMPLIFGIMNTLEEKYKVSYKPENITLKGQYAEALNRYEELIFKFGMWLLPYSE